MARYVPNLKSAAQYLSYIGPKPLLHQSFRHRRDLLRATLLPFKPENKRSAIFAHVESCESTVGRAGIETFWRQALDSRCEGLMVKVNGQCPV
jgi:DNA ligase 1